MAKAENCTGPDKARSVFKFQFQDLITVTGGISVGKAELGIKRICPSCGTRYYDLNRMPPVCPACNVVYDPEALLKSRRVRIPNDDNLRALEAKSSRKGKKAAIEDDADSVDETILDDEEASELEEYEDDLQELGGEDVEIVEGDDDLPRSRIPSDDDDLDDDDLSDALPDDLGEGLDDDLVVVDEDDLDDDDLGDIDTDDDEDDDR